MQVSSRWQSNKKIKSMVESLKMDHKKDSRKKGVTHSLNLTKYCDTCRIIRHNEENCWKVQPDLFPKKWIKDDRGRRTTATTLFDDVIELKSVKEADKSFSLMAKSHMKSLDTHVERNEKEELFTMKIQVKHEVIEAIMDTGSQKNLISNSLARKLGFTTTSDPSPYSMGWIQKYMDIQVNEQHKFRFVITSQYIDEVIGEVVPLDIFRSFSLALTFGNEMQCILEEHKNVMYVDNKLNFIPTEVTDEGCEVVIFDEALVDKGSNQWKLTVCGHFVGYKMSVHELRNESGMNKIELTKIPLWVSMVNVPLEAWSTAWISALASSLGKPIIMDNMTAKRCKLGEGRMDFARVLMEFDVHKGLKEKIEIQYRDKSNNVKGSKQVIVEYAWKPERKEERRATKQRNRRNGDFNSLNNQIWNKKFDDRRQVRDGRVHNNGDRDFDNRRTKNRGDVWKKKETQEGGQRANGKEKQGNEVKDGKGVKVGNKFDVLSNMEDDNEELEILKGRMIVDGFIRKNRQPNGIEIKGWTHDMVTYFRKQLEVNKLKEMEDLSMDTEDVLENNTSIAKRVNEAEMEDFNIGMWNIRSMNQLKKQKAVIDFIKNEKISVCGIVETHIKAAKLSKVADIAFGGWDWVSNSIHSCKGCRIIIGWDKSKVDLMVLHMTSQLMFVAIELIKSKQKVFCCYVYASNSGVERRILWNELRNIKAITRGCPWLLMGDFNVTLNLEEHSAGGSKINGDMQDFRDCVNDIEVEDINSSGMFFTWIKSPLKPETSVLKKLDKVMISTEFIDKYGDAYASFLHFLIFDHSPVVLHIPNTLDKKKKSFRFSKFVAEKPEFLDVVKKEWKCDCDEYSMYKLIQKMMRMKDPLNRIAWKNGNLFQNVKKLEADVLNEYNIAIDDEEKLLAQKAKVKWLSEGDKNTKYFHNVIKSRRHSNRVRGVCDENRNWFEGDNMTVQFVNHFEKFLGNKGDVEQIENPSELFTNKISQGKAEDMVREVTNKEIKDAIFDIVKEFFKANKLLGEFNATLITLVPKIQNPNKVSDFRPIACCNVVYKCISKIITNRIQGCLADIVSINQSDFVPGRLIQDNLLITQELLKGYNRKNGPQRLLLSQYVSMVKDMDTSRMRKVRNNNQFKYHWGCKELKLTQLCFADDLLMLSNGDYKSIEVLKEVEKRRILEVMPFAIGKLPMKYLGVPLITKNIGITECNHLVDRVKQKVNDWKNKTLSYAGRLQLIASVLASMHIYWASVFLIPKSTVKDIEKVLKGFLWSQGDLKKGAAKIAWKIVCTPKNKGGLGIKSLGPWNEALLCKHLWNVSSKKDSLWVKWINIVKLKGKNIWEVDSEENDSGTWKALLNLRSKIRNNILKKLGNGEDTNVWFDNWSNVGPICDIVPFKSRYEARLHEKSSVADMLNEKEWNWPSDWKSKFREISKIVIPNLKENVKDSTVWRDGNGKEGRFSTKKVWENFRIDLPDVNWYKVIWFTQGNPRYAFIMWLAMHIRLTTQDRLIKWGKGGNLLCPLCKKVNDSHEHLFFKCPFSEEVWNEVKAKLKKRNWDNDWRNVVDDIAGGGCKNNIDSILERIAIATYKAAIDEFKDGSERSVWKKENCDAVFSLNKFQLDIQVEWHGFDLSCGNVAVRLCLRARLVNLGDVESVIDSERMAECENCLPQQPLRAHPRHQLI
ncbi:RNA-directed DNA polymerase, eukaryota, reverse transcriptase zinc-binding domain protein [Tanacetum coccineum]